MKSLKIVTTAVLLLLILATLSITYYRQTSSLSFIVFGDSGTGNDHQKNLANLINVEEASFALHTGDIAYPCGTSERYVEKFEKIYSDLLERAPIYPSPGNHDYKCDSLASYLNYFEGKGRFYSFDVENAHFISLDSNIVDEEQLNWLEEDLSKSEAPIKVAFFHHPPYSSGSLHGGSVTVQENLVPLFEKYGVDLVFSGHEHNYERIEVGDPVYIVTGGGGGNSVYPFGEPLPYSKTRLQEYHFVRVFIEGCEAKLAVVRANGELFDQVTYKVCED